MSLLSKKAKTVTLFHGTCAENAKSLVQNGWQPNQVSMGGNAGQTKYLYLTSGYEDALWYAGEKGCDAVVKVTVPMDALAVDPEDGVGETVEEELNNRHGLPGKVVLTRPLPAANFSVVSQKTAKQYDNASTQINVPEEIAAEITRIGQELIPDEHLAGDGRVEVIHITVKYGVQPDERLLRQAMAGFKSFPVELGKTMVFPEASTEGTPVVIEVHGHGFEELHKAVANAMGILPDEFPYTPHITVAYVTQVEAQHYAGRDEFAGIKFTAEAVTLSMFDDDNQVDVPLAKAAAAMLSVSEGQAQARGRLLYDYEDLDDWSANMETKVSMDEFPIAVLNNISVPMDQRGTGLGKIVLEKFVALAKSKGAVGIMLVASDMDKQREGFDLVDWYSRLGFEEIGSTELDAPVMFKTAAKGSPNSKPPFWFQPGFDPKIQAFIMKNRFPNEGISCWDESYRWAEKLLRQGYDVDLYGGMYTGEEDLPLFPDEADNPDEWIDHGRMEGHTWLAVNGYIFDPTARQFNSEPDSAYYKDDSWEDAEELKHKFKIAAAPAQIAPELPQVRPQTPQQQEPEEDEEVQRDEPATEKPQLKQKVKPKTKAKPKLVQPKQQPKPKKPPVESKNFKAWFGKSKVVDDSGKPLRVYHGTTHDFTSFDINSANVENYYGQAFYFTSDQEDLGSNYATESGPDLTSRIEQRVERIMQDWEDQWDDLKDDLGFGDLEDFPSYSDVNRERVKERAWAEAKGDIAGQTGGLSMPVYLSLQNPVIVQPKGGTYFSIEISEDGEEESGNGVEFYNAMMQAGARYENGNPQEVWNDVAENMEFTAYDFEQQVRNGEYYFEDSEGNQAAGAFIADTYRAAGFDGIIQDAYSQFGAGGRGKPMNMEYGTKHFILWDPSKIKSAIGNTGKFDPTNTNITASLPFKFYPITDEWIDRAKQFLKEKWAQRHTELQREGVPTDLKGACKFASIFAQKVFGGQIKGNPEHQVVKTPQRIIDLTDEFDPNTFRHDKEWFGNPEHEESMQSCLPRVNQWYEEFRQKYPPETAIVAAVKSNKVHIEPLPAQITDDGWLTPDNKWIDTSLVPKHDHIWTAKQLGFKGVDPRQTAAEAGYTRVVIWLHVNEAIFMFASPLVAQRKMPLLLKHLPDGIDNVSVEESRGHMENYEIGDAWDHYVYGNAVTAAAVYEDDPEIEDEPQTWEQFTTLQPGTTLYHGTSNEWEEGSELSFPAWFSTNKNVADWFAHRNGEGTPMIRMYRVSSPIQLVELVDKNDMQQFFEMYGIEDYGIETISEGTINAGFEGWYIPDNYRPGDDIMLGDGSKLEYMETHPASKKANRFISGVDPRITAGATGVGDLGLAKKIMHELMPVLGEKLPDPELKIVNQPRAGWLGRDTWRIGIQNGRPIIGENTIIELQKSIINDEETLRRILAHELAHHADSLINGVEEMKKVNDLWTYKSFLRGTRGTGHGVTWKAYAQKFNAKYGADFVTEKSDETYVTEETELKPYHILLERGYDGKLAYEVSSRMTAKQKRYLDRLATTKDGYEHRLTQTNDAAFYKGHLIGSFYFVHPKDEETQKKLETLWAQAKPLEPTGAAKEQDDLLKLMRERMTGPGWEKKRSAAPQLEDLEQAYEDQRSTSLPQIEKLERPVSKDYDRVAYVYNQMYNAKKPSLSWKDFQKMFPKEQNSPLFTQIRQNRPQITLEDLDRWLEEYKAQAEKGYSNYELEHGTYRDPKTSFRDVEQLVLRVNQSASAAEIIGEDPLISEFIGMVQQGAQHYGHPVSKNTVGWLRVDFVSDNWLLVDEVQSDLVNAVAKAKQMLTAPNLKAYIDSFPEALKARATEELKNHGINEQRFQISKQQVTQRGYTIEKLEEIKQQLIGLFKDWAEYALASVIEIARRQGIKNVAVNTGENLAARDPLVEEKSNMYYDQLAKAFGFKKQQVDEGAMKGNFWVRTASAASNLKAWFDGSKVVDEKGNPRVVYHGSRSAWLTQFDLGREGTGVHGATKWGAIWFTSSAENAEEFADPKEEKVEADLDEIVSYGNDPFYAAVYDINGESLFQVGPHPTEEEAEREGLAQAKLYNQNLDKNTNIVGVYLKITNPYITDKVPRDAEFKAAKQGGHDGIIAYDVVDGYTRSDVFVIFSPSQAKSAERNVGTYDPNSVSLTAGKRSEAVTSMTVGTDSPEFPSPVLIRWEQGMRWREVLKVVKSIVGEVAGHRVPWREIHIWASLWADQQTQNDGWVEERAKGTRVMYDILHNGSFVSVGKPTATAAGVEQSQPEYIGNCTEDEIVAQYFGDATRLAQAVENGEKRGQATVFDPSSGLLIRYNPATDIHSFYKAASHKETPLSDTMFNEPEYGTETNAYANMPEKVKGDEELPALETLAPQMFEKESAGEPDVVDSAWLLQYIDRLNYDRFEDRHRIEEYDKWKKITVPISKLSPDYAFRRSDVDDYAAKEGPYPPIVLDPRGNIIDGHHRTAAAAIRGDKTIEAYIPVYPGYGYRFDMMAGAAGPTPEGVEYRVDVLDSRRGELYCMAEAWLNGERIGTVNFNELEMDVELSDTRYYQEKLDEYGAKEWERTQDLPREIFIKYVWVEPQYRRRGIATGMYEKIKQEFPGEKIISSGTTDEGGAMRRKMVERGVLASVLFQKNAEYAEQQNQVQHTDHTAIGLTKTLKSNPFHDELQLLNESLGQEAPEPNPALESARTEGQPSAKGEDKVTQTRTGASLLAAGRVVIDWKKNMYGKFKLTAEYSWHEHGDPTDEDEEIGGSNWNLLVVNAFDTTKKQKGQPGLFVGAADFVLRGGQLESSNTEVNEEYRRQGVATAIYQYAEGLTGFKVKPHLTQTPAGRSLWQQKGRPFGKGAAEVAEQEPQVAKQPWEMKRDEYAPRPKLIKDEKGQDIYEDETDEQARERYRKSREWEQDSLGAMSLGKMTPEQAKERGYWTDVDKPSAFKPLPAKLYHVTTNASAVYSQGLKTRHELAMDQGGTGLGGGTDKAISFTTDLSTASGIYRAIIEGIRVLTGKISVQRLIDEATKGVGADRPWINELINWGGAHFVSYSENDPNRWTPGKPYPPHTQAFFEGKKIVSPPNMGTPDEEMGDAEPIGYGWTGGDGKQRHTQYKVKLTPEELRETTFDFFKTWLTARENAGGHLNPLFFSSNVNALAATPEDEVAILEFKPVPGALGTQESALGEWRVYTGRAVQLVGTVPPNVKVAKRASNIVSGEDVVTYVQKLNKWDRQTAYQVVGLDAGGDYILTPEYDLDKLEAGDDYDPEAAERYAKMKTPFPPIVLNIEGKIRDGNHRVAAAKLRGDKYIAAYEPLDTYEP